MRLSTLLPFVLALASATQGSRWQVVRDDYGVFLHLLPVVPRAEYWLRPSCVLLSSQMSPACPSPPQLQLRLSLWSNGDLSRARRALRAQGLCQETDPCRVLPFQAQRVAVQDQRGQWEALAPWLFVAGSLPPRLAVVLRPRASHGPQPNCSGGARPRRLSPGELSGLAPLMLVLDAATAPAGTPARRLRFAADDVAWAARRLGLRLSRGRPTVVDGEDLRALAALLLRSKLLGSEPAGDAAPPRLRASLEMALVARRARYSAGLRPFLARARLPAAGEVVTVLRNSSVVVGGAQGEPPGRQRLRLSVSVPPATKATANGTQASGTSAAPGTENMRDFTPVIENLRAEIDALKRKVANATSKLASDVSTLKKANSVIAGKLNISSGQVAYPGLVTVNDCIDVKRRRLTKGVFLFKATGKPIVCSADGQLIVLSRSTGDVSFERKFAAYERGFGNLSSGDHWVGLQSLSAYTRGGQRCVTLTLTAGRRTLVAKYSNFRVTDGRDNYRLLYDGFSGNISYDALAESKGQGFSTVDNDQDSFPGSCAKVFKSGNWFRACHHANPFGPLLQPQGAELGGGRKDKQKTEMEGMCWRGMDKSEMCAPLSAVEMRVKRVTDKESRRDLVWSSISKCGCSKAKLQVVTVNETALYSLTAGGGGGGRGHHSSYGYFPGGRGAVVKISVVLKKGTELGIVAGCGGRASSYSGDGGCATVIADRSGNTLLAMAGGGGGGSHTISGLHGRATEEAGDAWFTLCSKNPTPVNIQQFHCPGNQTGQGWIRIKKKVLGSNRGVEIKTGQPFNGNNGGAGGGYNNGGRGINYWSPGGGGGSYCNRDVIKTCTKEAGGNAYGGGFVLIEKHECP